jgi:hypothetical protein
MKNRGLSQLGMLSFGALLLAACGGSSATGGAGGAGGSTGSAGATGSAGTTSSAGSTSSAGTSAGGASSGGTTSSAGSGGTTSSGGKSSGGMSNGGAGADTACKVDTDCVACAYPTAPEEPTDCYCASCAGTPLAKTACTKNQAAWQATCSALPRACPAIACIRPPVPVCNQGMCAASMGGAAAY